MLNYSVLMMLLLFIGIILITIDLVRYSIKCGETKVIYRYIPRSFNENYDNEVPVTEIFEKMFLNPSPWVDGINTYDRRGQEEINKFFISQM